MIRRRFRPSWQAHLRFFEGRWRRLLLGIALSILNAIAVIPIPILVAKSIDEAVNHERVDLLFVSAAGIVGITVVAAVVGYIGRVVALRVTKQVAVDVRMELLERLYDASYGYVITHDQGEFHEALTAHVERADQGASILLRELIPNAIMVIGMLALLVTINAPLTLVTLAVGALYVVANRRLVDRLLPHINANQDQSTTMSTGIWASLRGQELARLQAAEKEDLEVRRAELVKWRATSIRRALADTTYHLCQQSMLAVIGAVILFAGGLLVAHDRLTIGELIAFYAGFALLRGPLGGTSTSVPVLLEGVAALDRLDRLRAQIEGRPYLGGDVVEIEGGFSLRDVVVDYGRGPVLSQVDLDIEPHRITALAGPNGCGKSTVVSLLLGLYRPVHGTVCVDGRAYDGLDLRALIRQIGVVPQEPGFFVGTVRENLTYGTAGTSDERLWESLRLATADEFVANLPAGLDTPIGDDGVLLSGGQRQRLAIARALVKDPAVLVLDEPTNHLDARSIDGVLQNLRVGRRRTVIVVTHLDSVLAAVDHTIRLKAGRIVNVG